MAINSHHLLFFCSLVQTRTDLLWSPSLFLTTLEFPLVWTPSHWRKGETLEYFKSIKPFVDWLKHRVCTWWVFTRVFQIRTASLFWPKASPPARIHTNNVLHLTCDVTIKQPINVTEAEKSRVALHNSQLYVNRNTFRPTKQQPGRENSVRQLWLTKPSKNAESIPSQEENGKAQETTFECDHSWPGKRWVE